MNTPRRALPYLLSILLALAVGGAAALLTAGSMDVYAELRQPPLAPPAILFPIVWTVLYILMGVSAAGVYTAARDEGKDVTGALAVYAVQLFFNFAWSIIFFRMRALLLAFLWLVLLWVLILRMIRAFREIRPWTGLLQIPYLAWVTFAGYLSLVIYLLNR